VNRPTGRSIVDALTTAVTLSVVGDCSVPVGGGSVSLQFDTVGGY